MAQDEEVSRDHNSTHGEVARDLWQIECPLDPAKMVRAADLSSVIPALAKVKCDPNLRTLVVNAVRITKGQVDYAQIIVLDAKDPPRISCALPNLFPSAPQGTRLTLAKKFSEFQFRPNATASEWLDSGKLELQVCFLYILKFSRYQILLFLVLVRMERIEVQIQTGD